MLTTTIITEMKLKNQFGPHAPRVLGDNDFLDGVEKQKKGERTKYVVKKPLPTKEEYEVLFRKRFTSTVEDLVADAFSEFESLASEMQDWYDNLPESFQNGDKGSQLQDAQSALEDLQVPDVADFAKKIEVLHVPMLKCTSRADRCSEAVSMLRDVIEELQDKDDVEHGDAEGDVSDLISDLESACDNAEGVEFPGMFS